MIIRLCQGVASRFRALSLRMRGAKLEGPVWLRAIEVPRHANRIRLGTGVALDRGVTLLINGAPAVGPAIDLGHRVYVNRATIIDAVESIRIGADTMIGPFCYITDHDHQRASGRPAAGGYVTRPVIIGARVWIGAHVSILKGVTIGDGATVGAGTVVSRDVPAGATVVGNPARVIRTS